MALRRTRCELPIPSVDRRRTPPVTLDLARPIVVAANRLPVTRSPHGWTPSPGGLVRALLPLLRSSGGTWVGWTGEADDAPEPFTLDGVDLHPVPVTADEVQDYYEGFSNDTLWPLYHDALRDSTYSGQHWEAYQTVNQRFADTLAEVAPDGAIVWIHDYHLQLVPQMLRDKRPDVSSGSSSTSRSRPSSCSCACRGAPRSPPGWPACDLVGFQRAINAANFVVVCDDLLGRSATRRGVPDLDRRRGARGRRRRPGDPPALEPLPHPARRARGRAARRRPPRLHEGHQPAPARLPVAARRGHARHRALRDGAGRHADARGRRALPERAPRDRAARQRDQRRPRPARLPGDPLPVPVAAARRARRALPHGRRDARDAAARRHEPRRQGVRHDPARRRRRARAVGVRRRGRRADRRRARQPARRPRAARGDRDRRRDAPPRAPGAHGPAARGRPGQRRAGLGRAVPRRPHGARAS